MLVIIVMALIIIVIIVMALSTIKALSIAMARPRPERTSFQKITWLNLAAMSEKYTRYPPAVATLL